MTANHSVRSLGMTNQKITLQSNRGNSQRVSPESFSRGGKESSSVDGMHPTLARIFKRRDPSGQNNNVMTAYVRHHGNDEPSAPPAYLMPQEAIWPEHRDPSVPSAPHACWMPQEAVLPQHRNPFMASTQPAHSMPQPLVQPGNGGTILPNGFQQLARR